MKVFFLDTSAIVRLYVLETGWRWIRDLMRSATGEHATVQVCYCDLALPETVSALRVRTDLRDESLLNVVRASGCMPLAADVVERQEIRGADAVHLAAALTARDTIAADAHLVFVSHDERQCRAAEREGLEVITPS